MRTVLLGGLAFILMAGAVAALFRDWNADGPVSPERGVGQALTEETLENANVFPQETVKKDARRVGGEGFATVEVEGEKIARLPAKPIAPKTPAPEKPKLPPVPASLQRPLIEQPGHLKSGDVEVRLAGIASPGLEQTCGTDARPRPCGREARTALRNYIRGRTVVCIVPREKQDQAISAQCTVGGKDVAAWLVEQGWAVAQDNPRYEDAMDEARKNSRGLWRDGADAASLVTARNE